MTVETLNGNARSGDAGHRGARNGTARLSRVGKCHRCHAVGWGPSPDETLCKACFDLDRDEAYLDLAIQDYIWSAEELYRDLEY